jgi:2-polyprenyl-6-methoxyphenol hydroxylase-like FAD-dependent oxidoreductase
MARTLDICIRGGGIVGHVLALLLARERLRVGLVVAPLANAQADVRAYALNQRARALLQDLRCWPEAPDVTPVSAMHVKETGGGAVRFDASVLAVPALAWIVDVPALEARLAQAVRFQPQISLLEAPADATLSVICEGRASVSRQQLGVEQEVMPYAQVAIAARLSAELPHHQVACQWFTLQDILGLLPMGGEGGNLLAAVWSIPADQKQHWLDAPQDMFEDRLLTASEGRFGRLRLQSARLAWPLQRATARQWSGVRDGRAWVLAGDAAHAVHPLAGQGLNLGLADGPRDPWARLLARCRRREDAAALRARAQGRRGRDGDGHGRSAAAVRALRGRVAKRAKLGLAGLRCQWFSQDVGGAPGHGPG